MHVPDELLRDGARAARVASYRVLQRAGDTDDIDAVVLIEPLILDRDERLTDVSRQRPQGYERSLLRAELTDQRPIAREDQ
jgi:hypothetical protein